ncbi:MAG: hypothetical protein COT15_04240 [Candidatus Diapherotrites archaeon CG08_land_8_20_14_0_20_34_12]|nr:MAG: hypothetical protein COT15_04240 [Candidatus Diapherotrites archaeon CG08_land_8_20_14_0_20_34_12]
MDKETAEISKNFAEKLKKGIKPEKILLFGSRARGDNFKTSDFDFIIVSEKFKDVHFLDRMSGIYKYWDNDYLIEPLCYTSEEFEMKKKQIGIVKKAVEEGIEICNFKPNNLNRKTKIREIKKSFGIDKNSKPFEREYKNRDL